MKSNQTAKDAAISTDSSGSSQKESVQALPKRAEEMVNEDESIAKESLSPKEAQRLLHELRALKMENEYLRQAQRELKALRTRHHDRYFDLYDLAPVGYFTLSDQGLILEANLTATTMLGVSKNSLFKQPISRFILPEDLDTYRLYCEQNVEGGVRQALEMRILSADGSIFWAHLQVVVSLNDNNTPVYWITLTDIDQRKKAEDEVQKEKALLRCLIDSVGDLIFIKDINGVYKACNKASEKFVGLPECEQIGKTDFDLFDRDMAETIRENDLQILASGKEVRKEEWVTYRDGRRGLLDTLKAPFYGPDGEQLGLVGISRDISERKQAEDALRESEERFRTLCDSAPIGIFLSDSEGNNSYCNPRWEEITGMTTAEARGNGWRKAIHPDDREEVAKNWFEAFTTDRLFCLEHRQLTMQGKTIWVRALATSVKDLDGTILGYVGTLEDITELRQSRQEMLRTQKLESLGVLAGGIAHDFNNILTIILGNVSLARKLVGDEHKAAKLLATSETASYRARALTQQLLTFARGGEPVKKVVDTLKMIAEAVGFVLQGANVNGVIEAENGLYPVNADEGQLSQVFSNLLINSKQAMPDGGTVTITAKNLKVHSGDRLPLASGTYVQIDIGDQGDGIPPEKLGKIFDPYFTTKICGTGLGLTTVYSIIKRHGGHISVTSEQGHGTIFTLYLPAIEEMTAPLETNRTPQELLSGIGRILIMDDDQDIRDLARIILEDSGYQVVDCGDGSTAVEQYLLARDSGARFDAVILDLTVPGGMGGREAASLIRKLDPAAVLIVSSGYSNDPVMADYGNYGFSGSAVKPYTFDALLTDLSHAMERSRSA